MLLIQRPETDPFFNIAAEEFILRSYSKPIFMVWRNDPCIIVGKHQNAAREINFGFVAKHRIPVIRRISGGGTVYHDPGNVNFSFIFQGRKENPIDFVNFTQLVIRFLATLGVKAALEGKSNLVAEGLKISGNSAHVHRDKVLYHGTLLFDVNLEALAEAVQGNDIAYSDRAVRSVRAEVGNIRKMIDRPMTTLEFIDAFYDFIREQDEQPESHGLSFQEKNEICHLAMEKYHRWSWNFGYSPDYRFQRNFSWEQYKGKVQIEVKEGKISAIKIGGAGIPSLWTSDAEQLWTGLPHDPNILAGKICESNIRTADEKEFLNQIVAQMF